MKDKVAFILYGDTDLILSENLHYIQSLIMPEGIEVEAYTLSAQNGIREAFEAGRLQSDAKYKVYLDQNAYVIDKQFLVKTLGVFRQNPQLGALGVRGYYQNEEKNITELIGNNLHRQYGYGLTIAPLTEGDKRGVIPVMALDWHCVITGVDTPWNGDDGNFHIVKSVELRHMGYETAVMIDNNPMVLFDNGI